MNIRNRSDLLWIFIASVLILIWGSIPTWSGYQAQNPALRFRGLYFDTQDYAVHIAMMNAGMHNELAYQFKFTTETHNSKYVRMFYIILGHISGWLGLASETTFELARWILGFIALFALYDLMRRVFPDIFWARIAFLLAALGSGLGWLQTIFNWTSTQITPIDFWLIDSYVFFSLSVFPHFAFVTATMCASSSLWLDYLERRKWQNIVWMACIVIITQFVNPIVFATVDLSFVGAALFSWWKQRKINLPDISALVLIAIAQIPLLAYNYITLSHDPIWSQFTAQNQTLSPPFDYYIWGFALFWLPAILGSIITFKEKSKAGGMAFFWVVAAFLLAYAPVEIQRRFLQNITIPLALLATIGLKMFFETVSNRSPVLKRWEKSLILLIVFFMSMSSIQLSLGRTAYIKTYPEDLYYPAALDNAVNWLRENAQYNDFVLASEKTSQVLAQKAGMRVYLGHEMETLNYETKQNNVKAFFQGRMNNVAVKPIKWVIYGPLEQRINPNFEPSKNLSLVYESKELKIFQVK